MIAAIHQPNFIPWIGYFYKILKADQFVLLDDVQFTRGGYTNRVSIKYGKGGDWLTVPLIKQGRFGELVRDVELQADPKWRTKTLQTLKANYGRAPYFKTYLPELEGIVFGTDRLLADFNIALIRFLMKALEIDTPICRSSTLQGISGLSTERLVSICRALGATEYLSGFGGANYQEQETFRQNGITLTMSAFKHPQYPQLWGEFVPGLSAIDLLFNCGPKSIEVLRGIA